MQCKEIVTHICFMPDPFYFSSRSFFLILNLLFNKMPTNSSNVNNVDLYTIWLFYWLSNFRDAKLV